jgi:hypothetical protein
MTFHDPAIADAFLLLQSSAKDPSAGGDGTNVLDNSLSWSFARLLTPHTSICIRLNSPHRRRVPDHPQAS